MKYSSAKHIPITIGTNVIIKHEYSMGTIILQANCKAAIFSMRID